MNNDPKKKYINKAKSFAELDAEIPVKRTLHELQSIFRRLDVNHDGELDMNEFEKVIHQMNLTDDEGLINYAFAESDKDNSGKLCMQDFEKAYDLLYKAVISGMRRITTESDDINYVFKCLRYGLIDNNEVIFEIKLLYSIKELEEQMDIIALDNHDNRVRWWIDLSIIKMSFAEKELVAKILGLSANDIILSGVLPETRESRMRSGPDSVSFFVQTMWIKNIPLVHTHGEFASRFGPHSYVDRIVNGIITRVVPFLTGLYRNASDPGPIAALKSIEGLFLDEQLSTITCEGYEALPLPPTPFVDTLKANYLLPYSAFRLMKYENQNDVASRNPAMVTDLIGIHMVGKKKGQNMVVSIHKMGSEDGLHGNKNPAFPIGQQVDSGVTGRILAAIRRLIKNALDDGIASQSNIADTPSHLVAAIINYVHQFTFTKVLDIDKWMNAIEADLSNDETATKHFQHIREVVEQISALKLYLYPINDALTELLEPFVVQNNEDYSDEAVNRNSVRLGKEGALRAAELVEKVAIRDIAEYIGEDSLDSAFNELVYGDLLSTLVDDDDGNLSSNIKGTIFWKEELDKYIENSERLLRMYRHSLEEKRNFLTFALTMCTILLMPLNVLTGYFGMNFQNMPELGLTEYPTFPGVKILWLLAGLIYLTLFILGFHYRIFHAAL